jgi:hypothetical protein
LCGCAVFKFLQPCWKLPWDPTNLSSFTFPISSPNVFTVQYYLQKKNHLKRNMFIPCKCNATSNTVNSNVGKKLQILVNVTFLPTSTIPKYLSKIQKSCV